MRHVGGYGLMVLFAAKAARQDGGAEGVVWCMRVSEARAQTVLFARRLVYVVPAHFLGSSLLSSKQPMRPRSNSS